ncbi:hypothetical protein ACFVRM_21935, partial [Bacillus velezensis]
FCESQSYSGISACNQYCISRQFHINSSFPIVSYFLDNISAPASILQLQSNQYIFWMIGKPAKTILSLSQYDDTA